jgi:hypothetical protein
MLYRELAYRDLTAPIGPIRFGTCLFRFARNNFGCAADTSVD